MSSKKKTIKKGSEDLELEEELILGIIKREPRRPKFIAKKSQVLNQNQVVRILNRLEKHAVIPI